MMMSRDRIIEQTGVRALVKQVRKATAPPKAPNLEAPTQRQLMLQAPRYGARLLRNNVGVMTDDKGNVVRYGVGGNGGSDCIGETTIVITPEMVGREMAIFTAAEVKANGRKPTEAQTAFLNMVRERGGIAVVVYKVEDFAEAVDEFKARRTDGG